MRTQPTLFQAAQGTAQVEELVLIVTVVIGFVAATIPLGSLLLSYCEGIELVLALPIP